MIAKPSISFLNEDSDPKLVFDTSNITTQMKDNLSYPTPAPPLADVLAANVAFSTAMSDAANGGTVLTKIKDQKRALLVGLLRQLAIYVQLKCDGDAAKLLSSGFPMQKSSRTPVGILQPPNEITLTQGARTGSLNAVASLVSGAANYNWRLTLASDPETVVQTDQTTAARTVFENLTPGFIYRVECNVLGSAGLSDWSNAVNLMVV